MKLIDKLYWIALVLSILIMLTFWQIVDLHSFDDLLSHPMESTSIYVIYILWLMRLGELSQERILRGALFHKVTNKEDGA